MKGSANHAFWEVQFPDWSKRTLPGERQDDLVVKIPNMKCCVDSQCHGRCPVTRQVQPWPYRFLVSSGKMLKLRSECMKLDTKLKCLVVWQGGNVTESHVLPQSLASERNEAALTGQSGDAGGATSLPAASACHHAWCLPAKSCGNFTNLCLGWFFILTFFPFCSQ